MGQHDALWAETFASLARLRARLASARRDREADLDALAKAIEDAASVAWASYADLDERLKRLEDAATKR